MHALVEGTYRELHVLNAARFFHLDCLAHDRVIGISQSLGATSCGGRASHTVVRPGWGG